MDDFKLTLLLNNLQDNYQQMSALQLLDNVDILGRLIKQCKLLKCPSNVRNRIVEIQKVYNTVIDTYRVSHERF